jgi:hypothetical protein
MQGVRRPSKVSEFAEPEGIVERTVAARSARRKFFPKGLEDFFIKLRRDRVFEAIEEKFKRASALKYWKKAQQC